MTGVQWFLAVSSFSPFRGVFFSLPIFHATHTVQWGEKGGKTAKCEDCKRVGTIYRTLAPSSMDKTTGENTGMEHRYTNGEQIFWDIVLQNGARTIPD
jgi:hypothetical protein